MSALLGMRKIANPLNEGRSSYSAIVLRLATLGVAFLFQVIVARLLGVSDFGSYALALSISNISVLFSKVGYDTAAIKYISIYTREGNREAAHGFLKYASSVVTTLSILIGLIVVANDVGPVDYIPQLNGAWALAFLIPLLSLTALRRGVALGFKMLFMAEIPGGIVRPIVCLALMSGIYIGGVALDYKVALWCYAVAAAIALVIGTYPLYKRTTSVRSSHANTDQKESWKNVSFSLFVNTALHQVIKSLDIVILSFFVSPSIVAIYAAATRIADLVVFALSAVNIMVAPRVAELYKEERFSELQLVLTNNIKIVVSFSIFIACLFILFGKQILSVYGGDFIDGYAVLIIFVFAQLVNSCTGSVGFLLTMSGNHAVAVKIMSYTAVCTIVLYSVLIPAYGSQGAAISSAISTIIWNGAMATYAIYKLKIDPTILSLVIKR